MIYQEFIGSLDDQACPEGIDPGLQALWHAANENWDAAHEIIQELHDVMSARIHAFLHRKEGDNWNAQYWHHHAGTVFPEEMSLEEEWDQLVRELTDG